MNLLSSETKNTEASTTSSISPNLCKGTFPMNFWRFSGVSFMPMKDSKLRMWISNNRMARRSPTYRPVPVKRGQMEFTRILWAPYSAASPLVACNLVSQVSFIYISHSLLTLQTAPLEALYHTSPGRGRKAPIEEMLSITPPSPCLMTLGMNAAVPRKMPFTLTLNTLSNSLSVTSTVGCGSRKSACHSLRVIPF